MLSGLPVGLQPTNIHHRTSDVHRQARHVGRRRVGLALPRDPHHVHAKARLDLRGRSRGVDGGAIGRHLRDGGSPPSSASSPARRPRPARIDGIFRLQLLRRNRFALVDTRLQLLLNIRRNASKRKAYVHLLVPVPRICRAKRSCRARSRRDDGIGTTLFGNIFSVCHFFKPSFRRFINSDDNLIR